MFSAIAVRLADPKAVPVKNPAIIDPLIFPLSFFLVSLIAHASMETSRIPIPNCARNKIRINKRRFEEGSIIERMIRAIDELTPPRMVYCFLFNFR